MRIPQSKGLLRKVVAISDAVQNAPDGTIVCWVDADTHFNTPIDDRFVEWVSRFDVVFIPSWASSDIVSRCSKLWPGDLQHASAQDQINCKVCGETGILVYVASNATRKVLQEQVAWYQGNALNHIKECSKRKTEPLCAHPHKGLCDPLRGMNDVAVFGHSMFLHAQTLRQGLFVAGCADKYPQDSAWVRHAHMYDRVGPNLGSLCADFPEKRPNVSPFHIFEYISHFAGGHSGLANHRAAWMHGPPKTKKRYSSRVQHTQSQAHSD